MKYIDTSIRDYTDSLADKRPCPGGGSASALAASIGASLNLMLINFGITPSMDKCEVDGLNLIRQRQIAIKEYVMALIDEDCIVFSELMDSILRKKATPGKYEAAATVPMKVCRYAAESMAIANSVLDVVSGSITADIECSKHILKSAFHSAKVNVEMNLKGILPVERAEELREELADLRKKLEQDALDITGKLSERGIAEGD